MSANILDAIIKIAATKQLDKDQLQSIILDSITTTLSKKLDPENTLVVSLHEKTGNIEIEYDDLVVEKEAKIGQMSILDAQKTYNPHARIGDYIHRKMILSELEPKLIKTVQKAISDRLQELENEKVTEDFNQQKHTIVTGRIKSIDDTGGYRIDIGKMEALLPVDEQIENEYYKVGDHIKAYVVNIRTQEKSRTFDKSRAVIILSRIHPEFVKKIFEAEIPEIFEGVVKVRKIVREPGIRVKVELETSDPKVDPLRACLSVKGTRLDAIRKELHGEQIDIVVHSEDPEQMVINALGIESIRKVIIERGKAATVIVTETDKVQAIGKQGKNAKLAAKLTGLRMDIFTEAEYDEKKSKERRTISHVTDLDGVTPKIAEILKRSGYTSVQDIFIASVDELRNLEGVGTKIAERLKEAAELF